VLSTVGAGVLSTVGSGDEDVDAEGAGATGAGGAGATGQSTIPAGIIPDSWKSIPEPQTRIEYVSPPGLHKYPLEASREPLLLPPQPFPSAVWQVLKPLPIKRPLKIISS
jgi:hypothetical protein